MNHSISAFVVSRFVYSGIQRDSPLITDWNAGGFSLTSAQFARKALLFKLAVQRVNFIPALTLVLRIREVSSGA